MSNDRPTENSATHASPEISPEFTAQATDGRGKRALVTGASGFIGARLVPALLENGWTVRVLARNPNRLDRAWRRQVKVIEGDADDEQVLNRALRDVDLAYYLLHSMDSKGDFEERDRRLAQGFADAARTQQVGRLVYLSGLHPSDRKLSPHLASRVEVGEILTASGVPTSIVQAGVVLGRDSASFQMLRHLTERLPVAVGPRWLDSTIQPIALDDAIHYLLAAGTLDPSVTGAFDVGMPEVLTYRQMMKRYADVAGLGRRLVGSVPVLTPQLASHWVGLITPVPAGVAKPLVGSLVHNAVISDPSGQRTLGEPSGGPTGFDDAVRAALTDLDPHRWRRTLTQVGAGVAACAALGTVFTAPKGDWYQSLRKPSWQPPPAVFGPVWTTLYAMITVAGTATIADLEEQGGHAGKRQAAGFRRALAANLVLNTAWSGLFFRAHNLPLATVEAAALAASSADLSRRAAAAGGGKAAALGVYAAWTGFATVLTAAIWRRNR